MIKWFKVDGITEADKIIKYFIEILSKGKDIRRFQGTKKQMEKILSEKIKIVVEDDGIFAKKRTNIIVRESVGLEKFKKQVIGVGDRNVLFWLTEDNNDAVSFFGFLKEIDRVKRITVNFNIVGRQVNFVFLPDETLNYKIILEFVGKSGIIHRIINEMSDKLSLSLSEIKHYWETIPSNRRKNGLGEGDIGKVNNRVKDFISEIVDEIYERKNRRGS